MENTKIQIATHDFGRCPRCGTRLLYMLSNYQLAVPGPGGTTISRVIGEDRDITGVCPKCNHRIALTTSVYGIVTPTYEKLRRDKNEVDKSKGINLIGYIE